MEEEREGWNESIQGLGWARGEDRQGRGRRSGFGERRVVDKRRRSQGEE